MCLLIIEAETLYQRLGLALEACYKDHPNLGTIPKEGTSKRIRKLRQVRWRAQRRLNRRKHAAGIPISINPVIVAWSLDTYKPGKEPR